MKHPAALIADDEPLLRERLVGCLARLWPGLQVVAQARNGREAVELFDEHLPEIAYLDVYMPGLSGVDAARAMHGRAQIPVDEVAYLKSDEKYTLVAWVGGEALIRKTIRELADELDPQICVQVHRSVIVNLRHVAQVVRGPNETADVHLRGRSEVLPVSRSYLHQFRQM